MIVGVGGRASENETDLARCEGTIHTGRYIISRGKEVLAILEMYL